MQVIFDMLLRNLIILFLGVSISACSIIAAPVTIPLGLAMEMTGKKRYYNPKYVVTKECTRNVAQVLAVETGIVFGDYRLALMQGIITRLLHTKSDQTSAIAFGLSPNENDDNYYLVVKNEKKSEFFRYYISYNARNLVLVLAQYKPKNKKSSYNYVNTHRGHESIVLVECKL